MSEQTCGRRGVLVTIGSGETQFVVAADGWFTADGFLTVTRGGKPLAAFPVDQVISVELREGCGE